MKMDYQDQLVVVTGGASGIGFATVQEFSSRGARCALIDRNGEAAREAAGRISAQGGCAKAYILDVADRDASRDVPDDGAPRTRAARVSRSHERRLPPTPVVAP